MTSKPTSFPVSASKRKELEDNMARLGIEEDSLVEKFITGSGKGGQKINKTASCVYLKHEETGIEIKCQKSRSQALNRYYARKELCERVDELVNKEKSKKTQAIEKIRRQKRKRSKRAKEKVLEEKKKQGQVKKLRKPPPKDLE